MHLASRWSCARIHHSTNAHFWQENLWRNNTKFFPLHEMMSLLCKKQNKDICIYITAWFHVSISQVKWWTQMHLETNSHTWTKPTWKPVPTSSAEFHCTGLWPQTAGQTAGSLGNHNPIHTSTDIRHTENQVLISVVVHTSESQAVQMKYSSEPTCSVSAKMTMRFFSSRTRSGSSQYD